MSKEVLNVRETAELLGLTPEGVRELARRGEIPAMRFGSGRRSPYRFRRSSLEAWMEGKEVARRLHAVRDL
ncbi:helix-turn-helix domain-containing protein [Cellulomonas uda]|uniref:Helix-turn-helix domain-containing protein n=1 Tax=Cellulomonas uda TaxID=1714 RepID=A0A4Y3KBU4_CELUD|nr:hypothetical protein CUD01_18560 [Cellulomonas uda]